jgi:hypothetical protein
MINGVTRPSVLSTGNALNRRFLKELFSWASKSTANLDGDSIALDQATRVRFKQWAFEEFYFQFKHGGSEIIHEAGGTPIRAAAIDITSIDAFAVAHAVWSIHAKPLTGDSKWIVAWPVIGGTHAYQGLDYKMRTYATHAQATAITEPVTLGGMADSFVFSGNTSCGIMIVTKGDWDIASSAISARTLHR